MIAGLGLAFRVDGEVLHVTGVRAFRILHAVLLVDGVEMAAGAGERRLALRHGVEMKGVLARAAGRCTSRSIETPPPLAGEIIAMPTELPFDVLQVDMLHLRRRRRRCRPPPTSATIEKCES